jgi:Tol biopolymer transport system component
MGALAAIGVAGILGISPAAFPGANGQIAFTRFSPSSGAAVYAMNADGTGTHRIVRNGAGPAWSSDGRRLAYSRAGHIYVCDASGGHARRVTGRRPVEAGQPAWAPDGKRIVFASRGYIYTVRSDGRGLRRITSRPFVTNPAGKRLKIRSTDARPAWSPDGKAIAFVHHGNAGREEVWTMRPDGSRRRQLTHIDSRGWLSPSWSPDGRRIVYARSPGVWVINADGSGARVITTGDGSGVIERGEPAWSPDGTEIAYSALTPSPELARRIFVVGADGSNPHVVSRTSGDPHALSDSAPDWQPLPK